MKKRRTDASDVEKRVVSVCSPAAGSGVTLVAAALACSLAENSSAAFAEAGTPYVFDAFDMGKKFLLSGFTDYFRTFQEGKAFRGPENLWHGVNWAVHPGSLPPVKTLEDARAILRFAERLPGAYTVLDCSGLAEDVLQGVLNGSDRIYLVVDPLPGKLIPSSAALQRLKYAFPGAILTVNRMNRGVHRRELDAYLGTQDYLCLPDLGAEVIYKAEYACVFPWDLPEGKRLLSSLKKQE
ncbi:MAG: hypothetical protein IKW92_06860 [Firmicutes bacterium]|nr:hypothetical protein [Bacillota bacterium]